MSFNCCPSETLGVNWTSVTNQLRDNNLCLLTPHQRAAVTEVNDLSRPLTWSTYKTEGKCTIHSPWPCFRCLLISGVSVTLQGTKAALHTLVYHTLYTVFYSSPSHTHILYNTVSHKTRPQCVKRQQGNKSDVLSFGYTATVGLKINVFLFAIFLPMRRILVDHQHLVCMHESLQYVSVKERK